MNTGMKTMVVLLAASLLVAVGCSSESTTPDDAGENAAKTPKDAAVNVAKTPEDAAVNVAKTPKDAAVNFAKSLYTGDKDLFLKTVTIDDAELAEAMFDAMAPMLEFMAAFEAEYGKEKMEGLDAPDIPTAEDVAAKLEVKVDGDKATGKMPDEEDPLELVKKDGIWKVDLSKDMPSADERDQVIRMAKIMGDAIGKAKDRIGKDSAEDVLKAMETAMQDAMKAMMAEAMKEAMKGAGKVPE